MSRLRQLAAGLSIAAAAVIAVSAVPASADPINLAGKPVVPQSFDIVGVGSDTTQFLFDQLSVDYNKTIPAKQHNVNHPYFYSWDAIKPGTTSSAPTTIKTKAGCLTITRPNGGNAGLKALDLNAPDGKTGHFCIDYARTASARSSTAPKFGPGGVVFVAFAEDALTYATRATGSFAPKSLTTAQLKNIYLCNFTNWSQVGGPNQPIKAYLPQAGASTTTAWLKDLKIDAPGACVNQSLEQNQGQSAAFNSPNAIAIYSVGDWIAQKFHSAACSKKPAAGQNEFGCNQTGFLGLNKINGVSPITTAKIPTINKAFAATHFTRTLYSIVRYNTTTGDHIFPRLEAFIASAHAKVKGYICTSKTALADIASYGFLPIPTCGLGS
jgi:ABC-type phosphate transport system substrate-binding protein